MPPVVLSSLTHPGILNVLPCQGLGDLIRRFPGVPQTNISARIPWMCRARLSGGPWVPSFPHSHPDTSSATRPQSGNHITSLREAYTGQLLSRLQVSITTFTFSILNLLIVLIMARPVVEGQSMLHPESLRCPKQCSGLDGYCETCVTLAPSHGDRQQRIPLLVCLLLPKVLFREGSSPVNFVFLNSPEFVCIQFLVLWETSAEGKKNVCDS